MGSVIDILDYAEQRALPDALEDRSVGALINAFYGERGIQPQSAAVSSLKANLARRLKQGGTHHHLIESKKVLPARARTGKQPTGYGDVELVAPVAIVTAPSTVLDPLREMSERNGRYYPTTQTAIDGGIKAFEKASKTQQEAAVSLGTAMESEKEIERVKRENAEELLRMERTMNEELRANAQMMRELLVGRKGGSSGAVTK
jgi:hypothetical protein